MRKCRRIYWITAAAELAFVIVVFLAVVCLTVDTLNQWEAYDGRPRAFLEWASGLR